MASVSFTENLQINPNFVSNQYYKKVNLIP